MRNLTIGLGFLLAGAMSAGAQSEVVIESFDPSGHVVFSRVTNAVIYQVEWAPTVNGPWTNFAGESGLSLNNISGEGSGSITAAVPMRHRVVAVAPPPTMALIPAGSFVMGNATNVFSPIEGFGDELPQHTVNVSAFYMDIYEVTKARWDEVTAFNGGNGYSYSGPGTGKATNHPVHSVNWFDAVKWCNARSERDGLTPVYYTDSDFTTVYKTGEIVPFVHWLARGYRLPTEAEWEKAARGGTANTRFPWTDYTNNISWAKANYTGNTNFYSYDLSGKGAYHPTFATNGFPFTSPVGTFAPNGYGLYDMAGNVWEWCGDWYDSAYYSSSAASDPRGPAGPLANRVLRGGAWNFQAFDARVANRFNDIPDFKSSYIGFRCAWGIP